MMNAKLIGLASIVGGVIVFALLSWGCILQIAGALLGIAMINYGLYLHGYPQIQISLRVLMDLFRD